ncbi:MAG: nucleotidyltransferase family protein [Gemmatimonadota bacterium]
MLPESRKLRLLTADDGALQFNALDLAEPDIRARFDWAVRQGRPFYLWPELPIHVWRACLFEIERTTIQILAGAKDVALRLPPDAAARAMGIAAFTSGMGPLLGYWLETKTLKSDRETERLLALHLAHARVHAPRLKNGLVELLRLLAPSGIPVTVIKGAATSPVYFPDPAVRPAADIDIVLHRADVRKAAGLLADAGYRSIGPAVASKSEWIPPGIDRNPRSLELMHAESGYVFDVHDSLDRNFDGVETTRLGRIEALSVAWPELAPNAFRLQTAANAALLALHTSHEWHRLQLIRVAELLLVLRRDFPRDSTGWGTLIALLERSRTERFAYPAFELVERLVPGTVHPGLRRRLAARAGPRLVRVMSTLRPGDQRFERTTLDESLIWAIGPWQVFRRFLDVAMPIRSRRTDRPIHAIYRERLFRILRGRVGGT